jgi:hypothetical protein
VELVVEDRMARGPAQKVVPVRPPRFLGERIAGLDQVEVPGHAAIRLEIYFAGEDDTPDGVHGLALYSAGTLVAEGFQQLGALGLDHAPWTDVRLAGLVDWPGLHVAPGSRRGVIVDEAGAAFARALAAIEPVLNGLLESLDQRRSEKLERTLVRDLQRAFRDFYRQRPLYSMLPVHEARDQPTGPGDGGRAGPGEGPADTAQSTPHRESDLEPEIEVPAIPELLPPGPLARVLVRPARVQVQCGSSKRLRALAVDETGRPIEAAATFHWWVEGPVGALALTGFTAAPEGESTAASASPRIDMLASGGRCDVVLQAAAKSAAGRLSVTARSGDLEFGAQVPVEVLDEIPNARPSEGIPEPDFVNQPGATWRSRMVESKWQVNSGHRDFVAVDERPQLKLRYLAMLFAKEIVLRSAQDPRLEMPLEQLVEVATFADWSLATRTRTGRRRGGNGTESEVLHPD